MVQLTPVPALVHASVSEHPAPTALGGRRAASAPDIPSVRAVYLKAAPSPVEGHEARLILVFLSVFVLTALGALGAWLALHLLLRLDGPPQPRVELVQVERPIPVPVPVPVVLAETEPLPEPERRAPLAPPAPVSEPAQAPSSPEGAEIDQVASVEAPTEWIEAIPFVLSVLAPEKEPPPPPSPPGPPEEALALGGSYAGKGDGRPLSLELHFLADGLLQATVERQEGEARAAIEAWGTWQLRGQTAAIVLMERSVRDPVAYSGTVTRSSAEGRMTQSGRNLGRFSVQRAEAR